MKKIIYKGPNKGFYAFENFWEFTHEKIDKKSAHPICGDPFGVFGFSYYFDLYNVTVSRFDREQTETATITAYGRKKDISRLERMLKKEAAKKKYQKQQTQEETAIGPFPKY